MDGNKMTEKQKQQFNDMLHALDRISRYASVNYIKKYSERDWGVEPDEALEMCYENVIVEAKRTKKGIREFS